jgi:hypothetical protein
MRSSSSASRYFAERAELGFDVLAVLQQGHGARERREGAAVVVFERLACALRRIDQGLGIGNACVVGRKLLPLAFGGGQLHHLGDLPLQPLAFALQRILRRARMVERGERLPPALPGRVQRVGANAGVGVEQAAHGLGARQALPRVLAVDVEQAVAELPQLGGRGRAAVDPAAAAALQVDRAAQQQRVAGFEPAFVEPGCEGRVSVELGADVEPLGAFAHRARVGTVAERQLKRIDQYRFARAGFAGQDREACRKIEFE